MGKESSAKNRIWVYIVCDDPEDVQKVDDVAWPNIEAAIEEVLEDQGMERNATVRGIYTWDEEKEILICSKCGRIEDEAK